MIFLSPQMPEEEAFCVLVKLMQDYRLRELFKPSMAELGLCMYQLECMIQVSDCCHGDCPNQLNKSWKCMSWCQWAIRCGMRCNLYTHQVSCDLVKLSHFMIEKRLLLGFELPNEPIIGYRSQIRYCYLKVRNHEWVQKSWISSLALTGSWKKKYTLLDEGTT